MPETTAEQELKDEIVELSIQLVQAKYLVEEALIRQEWIRKVRQLIKEKRDQKVDEAKNLGRHDLGDG